MPKAKTELPTIVIPEHKRKNRARIYTDEELKEKRRLYSRQWRQNNLERSRLVARKYYAENRERILAQRKKRRDELKNKKKIEKLKAELSRLELEESKKIDPPTE